MGCTSTPATSWSRAPRYLRPIWNNRGALGGASRGSALPRASGYCNSLVGEEVHPHPSPLPEGEGILTPQQAAPTKLIQGSGVSVSALPTGMSYASLRARREVPADAGA